MITTEHRVRISVGTVLRGRYEIGGVLGSGGFAIVYEGRDLLKNRMVAIKVLNTLSMAHNPEQMEKSLERFRREGSAAASINHANVVEILDMGTIGDLSQPFIVMERLYGQPLSDELRDNGPIDPVRFLPLLDRCLSGLATAHAKGIVHRDLKPSNLYLHTPIGHGEQLYLVDFGIAHLGNAHSDLTGTGNIFGTPRFLPPEYIMEQRVTPALDVYQMGLMIAEALTGVVAVRDEFPVACFFKHVNGELKMSRALLESELGEVIIKALAPKAEDRYSNAEALRWALSLVDPHALPKMEGPECSLREFVDWSYSYQAPNGNTSSMGVQRQSGSFPGAPRETWPGEPLNLTPAHPVQPQGFDPHDSQIPYAGPLQMGQHLPPRPPGLPVGHPAMMQQAMQQQQAAQQQNMHHQQMMQQQAMQQQAIQQQQAMQQQAMQQRAPRHTGMGFPAVAPMRNTGFNQVVQPPMNHGHAGSGFMPVVPPHMIPNQRSTGYNHAVQPPMVGGYGQQQAGQGGFQAQMSPPRDSGFMPVVDEFPTRQAIPNPSALESLRQGHAEPAMSVHDRPTREVSKEDADQIHPGHQQRYQQQLRQQQQMLQQQQNQGMKLAAPIKLVPRQRQRANVQVPGRPASVNSFPGVLARSAANRPFAHELAPPPQAALARTLEDPSQASIVVSHKSKVQMLILLSVLVALMGFVLLMVYALNSGGAEVASSF